MANHEGCFYGSQGMSINPFSAKTIGRNTIYRTSGLYVRVGFSSASQSAVSKHFWNIPNMDVTHLLPFSNNVLLFPSLLVWPCLNWKYNIINTNINMVQCEWLRSRMFRTWSVCFELLTCFPNITVEFTFNELRSTECLIFSWNLNLILKKIYKNQELMTSFSWVCSPNVST